MILLNDNLIIENCDESRIPVMVGRAIEYVQTVDNDSTK
nr:MAG TPA: hypothetical protein [Microviridae sp.]